MSSSTSCLAGYRAFACRPRGKHSSLSSLKLHASIFAAPSTPTFQQEFHSNIKPQRSTARVRSLAPPRPLYLQNHVPKVLVPAVAHYASHASEPHGEELPLSSLSNPRKYSDLTIGIPKESYPGERRVAITPQNVKLLLKKGFSRVLVERGAGVEAQFTDETYEQAGAETVDRQNVFSESDILLKVRAPSINGADSEINAIRDGATVISFLYPIQNRPVVDALASRKATAFAMDMVPRISRAQVFDALR